MIGCSVKEGKENQIEYIWNNLCNISMLLLLLSHGSVETLDEFDLSLSSSICAQSLCCQFACLLQVLGLICFE